MAVTPVKVFLFLLGGTAAAGATAYVAGVFDPLLDRRPSISQSDPAQPDDQKVAELPPAAVNEPPAPLDTDTAGKADPGEEASGPVQQAPDGQPAEAPATGDAGAAAEQEMAALPPDAASPELPPPVIAPSFDLVRVESDGSIVIAGRAAPNSYIEAVIGSRVIGTATADKDGAFAIVLDEPLEPGDYQIVLRSRTLGNVVATSIETAVVSIPDTEDGQVLALVEEPGKPAELITVPKPVAPPETVEVAAGQDGTAVAPPKPEETALSDEQAPDEAGNETAAGGSPTEQPAQETAETKPAPAPAADAPPPGPRVAVEAIEIEGRRIFIAGMADPRRLVRAYANENLLGEATASTAGRFLVEAERELPVGDYIIRVDALEPNGAKVVARAAVPFEREAGENIAAVAPPARDVAPDGATPKGDRLSTPAEAEATAPAGTPVEESTGTVAEGATPLPSGTSVEAEGTPGSDGDAPADVAAATDAAPADVPPDRKSETVPARQPRVSEAEPATPDVAVASAPATADAPPAGADTLSPKLQNVDSAVIIRRGDTLWRISRRVYGRGVRYSTIYLANQDQIQDPDLILPGQVFKVPDRTQQGEAADLTQMGDQAVESPVKQ